MKPRVLIFLLLLVGCIHPDKAYVEADRSTYQWAEPKLREWSEAQTAELKSATHFKLKSWEARITKAEDGLKETP